MSNSKLQTILSMYGALSSVGSPVHSHNDTIDSKEYLKKVEEKSKEIYQNRLVKLKKRGVREWRYIVKTEDGDNAYHIILARNKKNADRKAKTKGYIS